MGNPFTSIVSGVGHVIGSIFGSPLDFLSGKSCSSLCGPTWDVGCYIENFCVQHLLKFFAVSLLFYLSLLMLYFFYKLRAFHFVFKTSFKMTWACFSTIFLFWENVCLLLFGMLSAVHERRKRHKRDIEMADMNSRSYQEDETDMEASVSYHKERYRKRRFWSRDHKRNLLRRSLRARSHRVHVGVDSGHAMKRKHLSHDDVRVVRTSSFARKGRITRDQNINTKRHDMFLTCLQVGPVAF